MPTKGRTWKVKHRRQYESRPKVEAKQEERRKKVLELNQAGMTNIAIAKALSIDRTTVYEDLRFISQQEGQEIHTYNTAWRREKWVKAINAIIKILPSFTKMGIKPSLRTIFYRLSSEGYIEKTENDYNQLIQHTVQARLGELDRNAEPLYPELPIDCFADETRRLIEDYTDRMPQEPENPNEYIDDAIQTLKDAPGWYDGKGTKGGNWYDQPKYVEVWIEKFALAPTFQKFLEDKYVNIVVNKGYSSLSFLWDNCQRLEEKIEKLGDENVYVLYFGDFDPSGEDMVRSLREYFERFDIDPDILEKVALTPDQIRKYNIPLRPLKKADNRYEMFNEEHGDKGAEIDAFFGTKPKAFEKMVQKAVDDHFDKSIYEEMEQKYKTGTPADELREIHREMFRKITDEFSTPGWYDDIAAEIEYQEDEDVDDDNHTEEEE